MSQKADTILRGTENEADAIVTLPGTWKSIRCHYNSRGFLAEQWVISINKKLIFSGLHCLNITVLHDFALFLQLK